MITQSDESLHHLTPKQAIAAVRLVAGDSHEGAATAAGVHRVTVTRWSNHHPAFMAEVNRLRADQINRAAASIRGVTERAVEVIGTAVDRGDVSVALRWCGMALASPVLTSEVGPTESVDVVEQRRKAMPSVVDDFLAETSSRSIVEVEAAIRARLC